MAEIDHLIEHRVGKTFDSSDAVSDLADDALILLRCRCPRSGNFSFNFRQKVSHMLFPYLLLLRFKSVFKSGQPGLDAVVINITADFDAHAADHRRGIRERDA